MFLRGVGLNCYQEDQCPLSNSSSLQERIKSLNLSLKEITAKVSTFPCPLSKEVSEVSFWLNFMSQNTCALDKITDLAKPFYRPKRWASQESQGRGLLPWWRAWLWSLGTDGFGLCFIRSCSAGQGKMIPAVQSNAFAWEASRVGVNWAVNYISFGKGRVQVSHKQTGRGIVDDYLLFFKVKWTSKSFCLFYLLSVLHFRPWFV